MSVILVLISTKLYIFANLFAIKYTLKILLTQVISALKRQTRKRKIRIFEAFAGIGAQHKAITNLNLKNPNFEIAKTSEWDARAIISYALIHHHQAFKKKLGQIKKWDKEKVNDYLKKYVFSLDSKKPANILRKGILFKRNLIAANVVNNNIADIRNVQGKDLKGINLLFYSFPCQGLSIANMGRDQGIGIKSNSTSNIVWEIRRILLELKKQKMPLPHYLILENVPNLLGKKHYPSYQKWLGFLNRLGYRTRTLKLNGLDYNSIQKRKRVFGISIINWKPKWKDKKFNELFEKEYSQDISKLKKNIYKKILSSSDRYPDEIKEAIPNKTKSRITMKKKGKKLENGAKYDYTFSTLSTKQDRLPNLGMKKVAANILNEDDKDRKLDYRFVTTREAYLIMGFTNQDFNKVKNKYKQKILTKESLYRQAGNAIIVPVAEVIFKFIRDLEKGKLWSHIGI